MFIRELKSLRYNTQHALVGGGIHPFYELLYITTGEMLLEWMGQTYRTDKETLFLINPNTPHKLIQLSKELSFTYVEFDLNEEEGLFPDTDLLMQWNRLQSQKGPNDPHFEWIHQIFRSFVDTANGYFHKPSIIMEHITLQDLRKLLLCVHECLERMGIRTQLKETQHGLIGKKSKESMIHQVMHFLECNYMEAVTLEELSESAHVNPSYLIRLFKEVTGMTPFQYLLDLRMTAATSLLRTTKLPIQNIAEASGFKTIHYFSRSFRKKYNVNPTAWRKRYQKTVQKAE
jgi:AraC-like DNA-binding protein